MTTTVVEPVVSSSPAPAAPSQEAIARRAYELWELAGRPEGQHLEHWLQAEGELRAASVEQRPASTATVPSVARRRAGGARMSPHRNSEALSAPKGAKACPSTVPAKGPPPAVEIRAVAADALMARAPLG